MVEIKDEVVLATIRTMLDTQDKLNKVAIDPHWEDREDIDFLLAIQLEAAEGIDHLGWKWWTPQVYDSKAAQLELIDIIHFLLSEELRAYTESDENISEEEFEESMLLSYKRRKNVITVDGIEFRPALTTPTKLFSLIGTMAGVGDTNFGLCCHLAERLGLDLTSMARLYHGKAVLNLFRQTHGYKEGTYVKMWGPGVEDNNVLQPLLDHLDPTDPQAATHLYQELEHIYKAVLGDKKGR